jgi:hypothetical protein
MADDADPKSPALFNGSERAFLTLGADELGWPVIEASVAAIRVGGAGCIIAF